MTLEMGFEVSKALLRPPPPQSPTAPTGGEGESGNTVALVPATVLPTTMVIALPSETVS